MDVAVSIIVGILLIIGALGTIIPILPGSILTIASLLGWAFVIGGTVGWTIFAIGALLCALGVSASTILTGTRLKRRCIPNSSILIGAAVGVIGMFVIPVIGLFIGFAIGLYASEWNRLRDAREALSASIAVAKSVGLGMLIEFFCACLAIAVWIVGLFIYF